MEISKTGRVDPRGLLRSVRDGGAQRGQAAAASFGRVGAITLAAAVSLASFGTIVVRANDDSGALAFIRSQAKPRPAPVEYAPRPAQPVSYYAPRAFFPSLQPQRRAEPQAPVAQQPRSGAIVASYAPFAGFFPTDSGVQQQGRRNNAVRIATPSASKPAALPTISSVGNGSLGGRVTYCVRTCDGFFFPLSNTSGSDRTDEAACNRMCPTSETKLYVGQIGTEIDEARARANGRRYAAMPNAFAYRTSFDKACTCSAAGIGLTNEASVARDPTLRVGDVVMTPKGMRVFTGGAMPHREASFTSIEGSGRYDGRSKDALRRMEQASVPGRSGVVRQDVRRQPEKAPNELADLRRATQSVQVNGQLVRYVGPDRNAVAR